MRDRVRDLIPDTALDRVRRARRWKQNWLLSALRTRYENPDTPTWSGPVIFLVGSARSGTTLLSEILGAAEAVDNHGEPPETFLPRLGLSIFDRRFLGLTSIDAIREELYSSRRPMLREGRTYVEKWPGNAFLIAELAEVFPASRFVHIVRDGRSVADSALRRYGGEWLTGRLNAFTNFAMNQTGYDSSLPMLARGGLRWRLQVEAAIDGLARLPASRGYQLRYEDLMARPREEIDALFEFLELSLDVERVPEISERTHAPWKGWSEADRQAFDAVAGELLERLGYERRG